MAARKKKKLGRPKKVLTEEEKLAKKRAADALRQRKHRRKKRAADEDRQRALWARRQKRCKKARTAEERRTRPKVEGARVYTWDRLLPYIDKQADGCWLWRGPLRAVDGGIRPIVRAGAMGVEPADFVVCCLAHGRPPPRCFVRRTCATIACVAPDHLVWTNRTVERAVKKERGRYEQEELARRERRRDEGEGCADGADRRAADAE